MKVKNRLAQAMACGLTIYNTCNNNRLHRHAEIFRQVRDHLVGQWNWSSDTRRAGARIAKRAALQVRYLS